MRKQSIKTKIFLNPGQVLAQIGLKKGTKAADFGSGNGFYTVEAAKLVGDEGHVYAIDILEEALSQTASLARLEGLYNVSTVQCDLESMGTCGVEETSCDLVILGSILHQAENTDNLLRHAYRVLKTSGRLLVVEWKPESQLGPDRDERLTESQAREILERAGLRPVKALDAGSFHYALLYEK